MLNVLITAASRRVPLVLAFRDALRALGLGGSVIVTDVNPLSPAVHVADRAYLVPLSTEGDYIDEIAAICEAESIGLVIPTIDDELEVFGAARERLAGIGARVVVSAPETTAICNDKRLTCEWLRARGVAAARSYSPDAVPAAEPFPLFIKPRVGRGGVGAVTVRNRRELEFFRSYIDDPIVQQYLDGPEFTLDVLCDFNAQPLAVVPRERVVIRSGVMDRGRTVRHPALIGLGLACAEILPFVGPVNIQCRIVDGEPTVFEINPRFSGGIPLTIAAGVDVPRLLLELALGRPVVPRIGEFVADLWMTSYEASLFFDRDRADALRTCPAPRVEDVA